MVVCYDGQQDASTSKVFLVNQPSMCHNSPQNSNKVNSKSTLEKSTLPRKVTVAIAAATSKSQCSTVYGQPLTLVLVPKCTAFQNRSLHQKSAPLDHALTKVNAGQTCMETLATTASSSSFFPVCEMKLPPRSSNQSEEER